MRDREDYIILGWQKRTKRAKRAKRAFFVEPKEPYGEPFRGYRARIVDYSGGISFAFGYSDAVGGWVMNFMNFMTELMAKMYELYGFTFLGKA